MFYIFLASSIHFFDEFLPLVLQILSRPKSFLVSTCQSKQCNKKGFRLSLVILKHHLLQPLQSVILSPVQVSFDFFLTMNLSFLYGLTARYA